MNEFLQAVMMLWIIAHALADLGQNAGRGKPFNCQLCLSGWISIIATLVRFVRLWQVDDVTMPYTLEPLVWWAAAVWIEALYNRLTTFIK